MDPTYTTIFALGPTNSYRNDLSLICSAPVLQVQDQEGGV